LLKCNILSSVIMNNIQVIFSLIHDLIQVINFIFNLIMLNIFLR